MNRDYVKYTNSLWPFNGGVAAPPYRDLAGLTAGHPKLPDNRVAMALLEMP